MKTKTFYGPRQWKQLPILYVLQLPYLPSKEVSKLTFIPNCNYFVVCFEYFAGILYFVVCAFSAVISWNGALQKLLCMYVCKQINNKTINKQTIRNHMCWYFIHSFISFIQFYLQYFKGLRISPYTGLCLNNRALRWSYWDVLRYHRSFKRTWPLYITDEKLSRAHELSTIL